MILKVHKKWFRILLNPEKMLQDLHKVSFEKMLTDYLRLLMFGGVAIGTLNLLLTLLKALYLDIFSRTDVQYLRMLNYAVGSSTSAIFLFLFIGTFGVFILSIVLRPFVRYLKYTGFLKVIFYSLTPLLLFGWIMISIPGMVIWTIILFVLGVKYNRKRKVKPNSIEQRD